MTATLRDDDRSFKSPTSGLSTPVDREACELQRQASHTEEDLLARSTSGRSSATAQNAGEELLEGPTATNTPQRTLQHPDQVQGKLELPSNKTLQTNGDASKAERPGSSQQEPILLTFSRPTDPENPYDFSALKKIRMVLLAFSFALMTGLTIGLYAAQSDEIINVIDASPLQLRFGISCFVWAVGFAPLVQAPFSEVYGRKWFYPLSGFVYGLTFLAQVWPRNLATLLIARTIQGISGAVGNTLVAGTLADLYPAKTRGWLMACFSLLIFCMIAVSVWLGDVINTNLGWRWIGWIQLIVSIALSFLYIPFLPETRGNVILYKRKLRLQKETGLRYKALGEEERQQKWTTLVKKSLVRPMYFLAFEPVVQAFSLWLGFLWGLIFLLLESVPVVFAQYPSFTKSQRSLAFMSLFIGASIGFLGTIHQEHLYRRDVRLAHAQGERVKPESRLYHAMAGGVGIPIGMFIFAWTGRPEYPWIAPCIGLLVIGASAFSPYMTIFSYLSDVYETYASSALACQSLLRNIGVGTFVLFAEPMYVNFPRPGGQPQSMSFALASTTLAIISAIMGTVPFLLYKYGEALRKRSKVASKIDRYMTEKHQAELDQQSVQGA